MKKYLHLIALTSMLLVVVPVAVNAQGSALRSGLQGAAKTAQLSGCSDQACIVGIVGRVIGAALGFIGILLLGLLLYGGFTWMTAAGSPEDIKKAKGILTNAIIGLVIIVLAFTISDFILTTLSQSISGTGGAGGGATTTTP